ncbi:hypothetical protein F7725_014865 [Dissostichus mawsoni]|uniref:Uncharacterized protein n=1 Tax=Dissostichus mawsoni TaxID=36200 RepID=A0A7J5YJB5_DISMA|nr:hypothetical protein F7725_014865 [Dissostichus mawsoni]
MRGKEGGASSFSAASSGASSCSPAHLSLSSLSQSEERRRGLLKEEELRGRKRKNHHRGREEEEEEHAGRFVGRMAVFFRGEEPITLHKFNHRKHRRREEGETDQSQKAVSVVRQNGFRAPPNSSYSQHACTSCRQPQPIRSAELSSGQSEALNISSGQWRFSDLTSSPPITAFCTYGAYTPPLHLPVLAAPMLRLSAVAVETLSECVRGGLMGVLSGA